MMSVGPRRLTTAAPRHLTASFALSVHEILAFVTHLLSCVCGTGWDIMPSKRCKQLYLPFYPQHSTKVKMEVGSNVDFSPVQYQTNIAIELASTIRIVGPAESLSVSSGNISRWRRWCAEHTLCQLDILQSNISLSQRSRSSKKENTLVLSG